MKKYEIQIMNESQLTEVDELMKDHGEALWAFGLECGNAAVAGFKRGRATRNLLIAGVIVVGAGIGCLGAEIARKREEKKRQKELDEFCVTN